jgi:hypothetical protein
MGSRASWHVRVRRLLCAVTQPRHEQSTRVAPRAPSDVFRPQRSTAELIDESQRPKIIAPVVKTKTIVPIQMKMAAFFSELIGVGVMTG